MQLRSSALLTAAWAAGLAGCTVGPSYHKPSPAIPASFGELRGGDGAHQPGAAVGAAADPDVLRRWWTVFHDPELESLLARALSGNRDLKVAVSRVREARAERQIVARGLFPEVDATAGYNRARGSENVEIPFAALAGGGSSSGASGNNASPSPTRTSIRADDVAGGSSGAAGASTGSQSGGGAPPGGPNSPFGEGGLPGVTTNLYQAGFDAVWEIDVFGGVRRAVEAADAETAAAREGEYGVRVTLLAEVATTYMQLRLDQQRQAIARRNVESMRQTWKIAQDRVNAGVGDTVEAAQELAQLRLAETTLPPLVAAERMSQHTLAFLLGEQPTSLSAELSPRDFSPSLPDEVPVGVPSDLLLRRPDVREAERQLAAASAELGVATAQLYPQFSLTGLFGIDSSDLKHLPEWRSRYYSIAPGISWPILDWAKLHAAIRVANEQQAQGLLSYQTAVSQALKDVEDALVRYEQEHQRHTTLLEAVAQARRARQVSAQIYSQGLADATATLLAERAVFQAEDDLAQSEASLRVELIALYKALGGGWEVKG